MAEEVKEIPFLPGRKKRWRPRSKLGCKTCRSRHIKCDETLPVCRNCSRRGFDCVGWRARPNKVEVIAALSRTVTSLVHCFPDRSRVEIETFYRYANVLAPALAVGNNKDSGIWSGIICSAAHEKPSIFDGILGISSLYVLPKADLVADDELPVSPHVQSRYMMAMDWYGRSVKSQQSLSQEGIDIAHLKALLIASIIYMYTEIRLGHEDNANGLLAVAFTLLHAHKDMITNAPVDADLKYCIDELRSVSLSMGVNKFPVASEHWKASTDLILYLNAQESMDNESILIQTEKDDLTFELDIILRGESMPDPYFEQRLHSSKQRLDFYLLENPDLQSYSWAYAFVQVQWRAFQNGLHTQPGDFEEDITNILELIEVTINLTLQRGSWSASWNLDLFIIPWLLFSAWYWRDEFVLQRTTEMLGQFDVQQDFITAFLAYIKILVNTEYHTATALESELLGGRPNVLQLYHVTTLVNGILRSIRDTFVETPRTILPETFSVVVEEEEEEEEEDEEADVF